VDKSRLRAFLKGALEKAGELLNLGRNQLQIMTGLLTEHCHIKGHPFKLELVTSSECDRYKQVPGTASHVLCDSKALATLRFRHLDQHIIKPGDSEDISVSRILHFVQSVGLLNA
jgi:hypothetical protein